MNQEKKITAPRSLWDRMRATMERDDHPTMQEAVRNAMRKMCEESEQRSLETRYESNVSFSDMITDPSQ